jgi:hypothetical protein
VILRPVNNVAYYASWQVRLHGREDNHMSASSSNAENTNEWGRVATLIQFRVGPQRLAHVVCQREVLERVPVR